MSRNLAPILVTGAHRTGTTWVGKILAAGGQAGYISEPLNVLHRPGVFRARVTRWYTYICQDNDADYLPAFRETLAFRYHPWLEFQSLRSVHDAGRMGRDAFRFLRGRLGGQRPLLKDPFAIFSIPWFIDRLGSQVVVTIRHPAAFASSLFRLDWPFQLEDLLAQPLLMRDWLSPYKGEIEALQKTPDDIIGQTSLLWIMVYQAVAEMQKKYPASLLRVVRHEDLSLDPVGGFHNLYTMLGLQFGSTVAEYILKSSSAENPQELSKRQVHSTQLDSKANIDNWKRRLSAEQVIQIRHYTEQAAKAYYPDITWE